MRFVPSRVRARTGLGLVALGLATACGGGGGGGGAGFASVAASGTSVATAGSQGPAVAAVGGIPRTAPQNLQTGPRVVLDASGQGAFFDRPFPSDDRRKSTGGPDLTGCPNPAKRPWVTATFNTVEQETTGFSPTGTIYFRFDAPINAPPGDPLQTNVRSAPILLVNVDPRSPSRLALHPYRGEVTIQSDSARPKHLLQVQPIPGLGLEFDTTYAVIVLRKLGAPGYPFLGQAPEMTALLGGQAPAGAAGAGLSKTYPALIAALDDLKLHRDDVAAATVFTTWNPTARLVKQIEHVASLPALPMSAPLVVRDVYQDFTALKAKFRVPVYQSGVEPFLLTGGRQVVDQNGLPVKQHEDEAELQVSVPKGKMPAKGFPLYFYCHGTGGLPSQAIDRGKWKDVKTPSDPGKGIASYVAPRGWGTSCMAQHLNPGRIGSMSFDGYIPYNFFNPSAMRDNFGQMLLELTHFRTLLLSLRIDPALCPGTDASASVDGKVRFDPDTMVVGGQSLGSYLGGMLAATLPGFKGAILTGAGGSWVEFAFAPKDPVDLELVASKLMLPQGEMLDRYHPLIMAFENGVAPADNTHYHRYILRRPLPGHVPPHVLVVEGTKDLQVGTMLQRALVAAIGVDLAGPDYAMPGDVLLSPVLPWAGRKQLPYPVSGNVSLAGGGTRTAVAVRYEEDGIKEGHYVSMQLDDAKRQIGEFISAIAAGQTPVVR